jgi:hypothetical protein
MISLPIYRVVCGNVNQLIGVGILMGALLLTSPPLSSDYS